MTTKAWLIFTPERRAAAIALNPTTEFKVIPRVIDNPLALNLSDAAVALGHSLAGASILNDPEYGPVWGEVLGDLPIRVLDSDILFLPPEA